MKPLVRFRVTLKQNKELASFTLER